MTPSELESLLQKLKHWQDAEFDRIAKREADEQQPPSARLGSRPLILHPPATREQIAAFERERQWAIPPSYKIFLTLHDGCENLDCSFTLIGVNGEHARAVEDEVSRRQTQLLGSHSTWEAGQPELLNEEPHNLFLRSHHVIGTNFTGKFMAFHRDWENEPNPLIQWGLFTGVDRRYSDFGEMMKRTLEVGL